MKITQILFFVLSLSILLSFHTTQTLTATSLDFAPNQPTKWGITLGPSNALSQQGQYFHSLSVSRHTLIKDYADLYFRGLFSFNLDHYTFLTSATGGGRYLATLTPEVAAYAGSEFGFGLTRIPINSANNQYSPVFGGYILNLRSGFEIFHQHMQSISIGLGLQALLRSDITGKVPITSTFEVTFFV